jgi:holin-like protein
MIAGFCNPSESDAYTMEALRGFALLLLLQAIGEGVANLLKLAVPGPVVGLLMLTLVVQWQPLRPSIEAACGVLLSHLSLLFVPVGVGVITHLQLLSSYGGRLLVVIVVSTWLGLAATALVLRALLPTHVDEGKAHG